MPPAPALPLSLSLPTRMRGLQPQWSHRDCDCISASFYILLCATRRLWEKSVPECLLTGQTEASYEDLQSNFLPRTQRCHLMRKLLAGFMSYIFRWTWIYSDNGNSPYVLSGGLERIFSFLRNCWLTMLIFIIWFLELLSKHQGRNIIHPICWHKKTWREKCNDSSSIAIYIVWWETFLRVLWSYSRPAKPWENICELSNPANICSKKREGGQLSLSIPTPAIAKVLLFWMSCGFYHHHPPMAAPLSKLVSPIV